MDDNSTNWEDLVKSNKLDASKRELITLKGIAKCKDITWLDVSNNFLDNLQWLRKLKKLVVLKASNNKITKIHHILHFQDLKALILNNNCLKSAEEIEKLPNLNSLVLSHNELEEIDVSKCRCMTKLSLSHNQLKKVPDLENLADLKELRLNDNQIKEIPCSLASCKQLKLVDFGNNKLGSYAFLDVLRESKVENLNLKGNAVCSLPEYKEKVLSFLPKLKVLDGRRVDNQGTHVCTGSPLKPAKKEPNEVESTRKQVLVKNGDQSEISKTDSKSKIARVGGFVSRFPQTSGTPEQADKVKTRTGGKKKKNKTRTTKQEDEFNAEVKSSQVKDESFRDSDDKEVKYSEKSKSKAEDKGSIGLEKIGTLMSAEGMEDKQQGKDKDSQGDQKISKKRKDDSGNESLSARKKSKKNAKDIASKCSHASEEVKSDEKMSKKVAEKRIENKSTRKNKKNKGKEDKVDKRSGVLAVKVVKQKQRKGVPLDVEALKRDKNFAFGVGEGNCW